MYPPKQTVRYIISGGSAALVHLVLLYTLTDLFGLWYLASLIIAFVFAVITGFTLQKLWTFNNKDLDSIHLQTTYYLIAVAANLALNAAGVYVLVSKLHMWYMLAQVIMLGLIAVANFFTYKHIIFK